MGSFGSWRRLGGGGGATGGGGGSTPVPPYEAPISGTSGSVSAATHSQGTIVTVIFKRSGVAFDTPYTVDGSGNVSWTSTETLNAGTDTILISG
jgi:hypothetical protein